MYIPKFEEFITYICAGIPSHRKRAELHDELLGHLEDVYEQKSATGLTTDAAQTAAIEAMGDREALRGKFASLYKFSPPEYMRTALNCLLFGTFFLYTRIEIVPLADKFLPFLGQILLVFALFRLYSFNKALRASSVFFGAYLLFWNVALFISEYDTPQNTLRAVFAVAAAVLLGLFYLALYIGIENICDAQEKLGASTPGLWLCILPQIWVSYCDVMIALNSDVLPNDECAVLNLEILLGLVFPLIGLWRAKRALSRTEPEFPLEQPFNKHKRIALAGCIVLCFLVPLCGMVISSTRAPQTESYVPADTEISTDTVSAARAHLGKLGLPQSVIEDLPDSEVLRYRTAVHLDKQERDELSKIGYTAYVFYLNGFPDTQNAEADSFPSDQSVRVLLAIDGFDNQILHLRDGVYFKYDWMHTVRDKTTEQEDFFLILSESDGKALRAEPFSQFEDDAIPFNLTAGYDFAFPKNTENRRIYFAASTYLSKSQTVRTNATMQYYHQILPLYVDYQSNHMRASVQMTPYASIPADNFATVDALRRQIPVTVSEELFKTEDE